MSSEGDVKQMQAHVWLYVPERSMFLDKCTGTRHGIRDAAS